MLKFNFKKISTLPKNVLIAIIIGVFVFLEITLFLFFGGGASKFIAYFEGSGPAVSGIILFEGNNCPQCVTVDNFIKNNKLQDKIVLTRLEVLQNSANAKMLKDKAKICGLDDSHIGVPFVWDGMHCIVGYIDVLKFFQEKIAKKP